MKFKTCCLHCISFDAQLRDPYKDPVAHITQQRQRYRNKERKKPHVLQIKDNFVEPLALWYSTVIEVVFAVLFNKKKVQIFLFNKRVLCSLFPFSFSRIIAFKAFINQTYCIHQKTAEVAHFFSLAAARYST